MLFAFSRDNVICVFRKSPPRAVRVFLRAESIIIRILKPILPRSNGATTTAPLHNRLSPQQQQQPFVKQSALLFKHMQRGRSVRWQRRLQRSGDKRFWGGAVVVAPLLRGGVGFNMRIMIDSRNNRYWSRVAGNRRTNRYCSRGDFARTQIALSRENANSTGVRTTCISRDMNHVAQESGQRVSRGELLALITSL